MKYASTCPDYVKNELDEIQAHVCNVIEDLAVLESDIVDYLSSPNDVWAKTAFIQDINAMRAKLSKVLI